MKREKPNASLIAIEGVVLFSVDQTSEWLSKQSESRRHDLMASAIQGAQQHRLLYRQRCAAIKKFRAEQVKEKEERSLQEKEQLTIAVTNDGC